MFTVMTIFTMVIDANISFKLNVFKASLDINECTFFNHHTKFLVECVAFNQTFI